ncbi:MAG: hypothetical protein AB1705_00875 [Verrucomicrobiota bacterium]
MNAKGVLFLSLFLNAGLLVALVARLKPAPPPPAPPPQVKFVTNTVVREVVAEAAPVKAVKPLDWRVVESEDYKKYIANLRAIGCPEETIRDIIIADVNKLFEARKKELRKAAPEFKFWQTGRQMFAQIMNEDVIKQNQELAQEKRALLKELLGVEPEDKADPFNVTAMMDSMLGFLPASKQSAVMELEQKYGAKLMKAVGGGAPDAQDLKAMRDTMREKDAELAKLLTPQEYEDYQLRMSQTSMVMRMQLDGFEPSEKEFRDVFKLQKAFDDEFGLMGMGMGGSKEEREKRDAAKKELDNQLKATLGEQRFADYQREQDFAYKSIAKVVQREGLSRDEGIKAYQMKKVAEDSARKVRNDPNLTPEERQTALQAIRVETERSLQGVLGEKAFSSYRENQNASYWLRGLSPDPKPAP